MHTKPDFRFSSNYWTEKSIMVLFHWFGRSNEQVFATGSLFVSFMQTLNWFWISILTRVRARETHVSSYFGSFLIYEHRKIISDSLFGSSDPIQLFRCQQFLDRSYAEEVRVVSRSIFNTSACTRNPVFGSFLINEPRKFIIVFCINSGGPGRMFLLQEVCL